jgi:transcription elongation GreA/GreB family factor
LKGGPFDAILVDEATVIDKRILEIDARFKDIVNQKKQVTGGDDWHDGAFRATDSAANTLAVQRQELSEMLNLAKVFKPEFEAQPIVSLGSRALISYGGGTPLCLDIMGTNLVDTPEGVNLATLRSPIGMQIIGKGVGEVITSIIGNQEKIIEILSSEPNPTLISNRENK